MDDPNLIISDSRSDQPNNLNNPHDPCYSSCQCRHIKTIYILGIVLWLVLLTLFGVFPPDDWFEIMIVAIPILVFFISFWSVPYITPEVEGYMFKANLLTLGLLIALPFVTWAQSNSIQNRVLFTRLAVTAIILSMLTLIDVWVPDSYLSDVKHVKSVLQTIAISLLIFGLYRFFLEKQKDPTFPDAEKGK